jgi:ribonuclease P/MRP protein subunit RPP1
MYEAVRPGRSTAARLAATARDAGFEGVVAYGADGNAPGVVSATEVVAEDPSGAAGAVGGRRPDVDVLAVRGKSPAVNRFAVEDPRVDVLARPFADSGDLNHVLADAAAEHGVAIEWNLGSVLRARGGTRVRALQSLQKLRTLIDDSGAPYVVTADPVDHLDLRAPRELAAVGEAAGADPEWVREGLREWARVVERNRERRADAFVAPGVRKRDPSELPAVPGGEER